MLVLLRQGRLSKWFSGIGQEAIATGVVDGPRAAATTSCRCTATSASSPGATSTCRAVPAAARPGGRLHQGPRPHASTSAPSSKGIVGMISHLGAMLPVACGLALAAQLEGERRVAAAFTGDGATSEGDFHEAMNLAAVWKLPVLFVIENNQYGLSTPEPRAVRLPPPRRPCGRLRHAGRRSWTATTCWRCTRCGRRGGRAGAAR